MHGGEDPAPGGVDGYGHQAAKHTEAFAAGLDAVVREVAGEVESAARGAVGDVVAGVDTLVREVGDGVQTLVDDDSSFAPVLDPARGPRQWWGRHLRETRWQWELARLLADPVWRGVGVPAGDGSPVLLIPGFLAGDASLSVMHGWLRRLGYTPRYAGIHCNVDCSDRAVNRLDRALCDLHLRTGQPVTLIGHSRGGHFAKALAHRHPDVVRGVVTMGSGLDEPFDISIPTRVAVAGVRRALTTLSPTFAASGCLTTSCACPFARDFSDPFPVSVPLTSVYSKGDGVVWWEACVVPYADCVEVPGSHVGLAFNRHVYRVIARTLAAATSVA